MINKIVKNQQGFSLTEVLIGMMILTVAIVTGTNLLVGLVDSNKNIVETMQAHYLAQEGIEAVRNIRDTNWLHNRDWLGDGREVVWGDEFRPTENFYTIDLLSQGWKVFPTLTAENKKGLALVNEIAANSPWQMAIGAAGPNFGRIYRYSDGSDTYFSSALIAGGEETPYRRMISIFPYEDCGLEDCEDFVLVRSEVLWDEVRRERSVVLEAVITDWKGGVL